jgi:RNA polymerase sigma-70 factor (ECF subfamily)
LVQTVFMKVFANLDQYQGRVPVEHWVSRIAVNTCPNALKAEKARPELRWSDLSDEMQHGGISGRRGFRVGETQEARPASS